MTLSLIRQQWLGCLRGRSEWREYTMRRHSGPGLTWESELSTWQWVRKGNDRHEKHSFRRKKNRKNWVMYWDWGKGSSWVFLRFWAWWQGNEDTVDETEMSGGKTGVERKRASSAQDTWNLRYWQDMTMRQDMGLELQTDPWKLSHVSMRIKSLGIGMVPPTLWKWLRDLVCLCSLQSPRGEKQRLGHQRHLISLWMNEWMSEWA